MKTSFGFKEVLHSEGEVPRVELLHFVTPGRSHRHGAYESFYVLSGKGRVYIGEEILNVVKGDLVTIPPHTPHWMEPGAGEVLVGLLWYHDIALNPRKAASSWPLS